MTTQSTKTARTTRTRKSPVVAIVGRPNVGKSTLVNRIVGRRIAIVEEHPGVTRDRFELAASWRGCDFAVIDTGGILERGDSLDEKVTAQSIRAIEEADLVLFILDVTTGPTYEDEVVAKLLRRRSNVTLLIANKVDSDNRESEAWALARLGFGNPITISALHGRGVGDLLDLVVGHLFEPRSDVEELADVPPVVEEDEDRPNEAPAKETSIASVAIVGRPNVGKSTLFNRLVGTERSVVHDVAGTTRDAVDTVITTDLGDICLIDTAGLRRKSRIGEGSEYYSFVRSLRAIDRADVTILVIDATEGVTHQDQRLAERIDAAGSPVVICLNKWDLLGSNDRLGVVTDLEDRLGFLTYAPTLRIAAKTGLGVHRLIPALSAAIEAYHRRIPTGRLNEAIKTIQSAQPAPRARILYAVQGGVDPPTVTLFTTARLQPGYLRYIERSLRDRFSLGPTPLNFRVRIRGS